MSAASQATGPVLSVFEMACANETFPALGRSLMGQRVLQTQPVSATDSVFSKLPIGGIATGGQGLTVTYRQLVHAAFQPAYWQDAHYYAVNPTTGQISHVADATQGYLIDELDFSMFFGMAIDAYERTLISDQSPFDTGTMSAEAVASEGVFTGKANCVACMMARCSPRPRPSRATPPSSRSSTCRCRLETTRSTTPASTTSACGPPSRIAASAMSMPITTPCRSPGSMCCHRHNHHRHRSLLCRHAGPIPAIAANFPPLAWRSRSASRWMGRSRSRACATSP